MAMNRRNVLIGLGVVAAGGGAALGTGAFSQVEAARTVSVSKAGDKDAFLGITVTGSYAADNSGGDNAVTIDLEGSGSSDGFNDDAETKVDGILTLTNNTADSSTINVGFNDGSSFASSGTETIIVNDDGSDPTEEVEFSLATTSNSDSHELTNSGDTVDVNAVVRTGSRTEESGTADNSPSITFRAESP